MKEHDVPNPGTKEAIDQGCTCPVEDNHHGKGVDGGDGERHFWYNADCPLHGRKSMRKWLHIKFGWYDCRFNPLSIYDLAFPCRWCGKHYTMKGLPYIGDPDFRLE